MSGNKPEAKPAEAGAVSASTITAARGAEFRFVHSNTHRLRTTINDLTVSFGSITDPMSEGEKFAVYEHVAVALSLGQAKLLARELAAYFSEADRLGAKYNLHEKNALDSEERAKQMANNVFSKLQEPKPEAVKPDK